MTGMNSHLLTNDPLASIERLFGLRSPTAVLRRIVAVIVNPINRVACCWSSPHVFSKVFKSVPPLTNPNTPTTVVMINLVPGVIASVSHTLPTRVQNIVTLPVFKELAARMFSSKTTTTRAFPTGHVAVIKDSFYTTVTAINTFPVVNPVEKREAVSFRNHTHSISHKNGKVYDGNE